MNEQRIELLTQRTEVRIRAYLDAEREYSFYKARVLLYGCLYGCLYACLTVLVIIFQALKKENELLKAKVEKSERDQHDFVSYFQVWRR